MLAGLDPLSLLELDGPMFDAVERAVEFMVTGTTEQDNGTPAPAERVGALSFATEFGPPRRRRG